MKDRSTTQICISLCESRVSDLLQAAERVNSSTLIELRLDCLDPSEYYTGRDTIHDWLRKTGRAAILTLRSKSQGGNCSLDQRDRAEFWRSLSTLTTGFFDIELDLIPNLVSSKLDWDRVICSYHDFAGLPPDLNHLYERMLRSPAKILKIAVQADDVTDCLPIFALLDRAVAAARPTIALAMGAAGVVTRILGPSRGAFLTYATMEHDRATAPGQLRVEELVNLYRIPEIDSGTQLFGVMGCPVGHSISPHIHNAAFKSEGLNAVYVPLEVHDANLFLMRMVHPKSREISWDVRGLSVTAPHKSRVIDGLDWIEPQARELGAVNTIVVEQDRLCGFNTDVSALVQPLIEKLGKVDGIRCAVVGTGGAARAALYGLRREGAALTILGRNQQRVSQLAGEFGVACASAHNRLGEFEVVINATPLGTAGESANETVATADQLRGARLAYDLVYNPSETRFLREAKEAGCDTVGGLSMLVAQGAAQFKLWTGREAPRQEMLAAAEVALSK